MNAKLVGRLIKIYNGIGLLSVAKKKRLKFQLPITESYASTYSNGPFDGQKKGFYKEIKDAFEDPVGKLNGSSWPSYELYVLPNDSVEVHFDARYKSYELLVSYGDFMHDCNLEVGIEYNYGDQEASLVFTGILNELTPKQKEIVDKAIKMFDEFQANKDAETKVAEVERAKRDLERAQTVLKEAGEL